METDSKDPAIAALERRLKIAERKIRALEESVDKNTRAVRKTLAKVADSR